MTVDITNIDPVSCKASEFSAAGQVIWRQWLNFIHNNGPRPEEQEVKDLVLEIRKIEGADRRYIAVAVEDSDQ